MTLTFDVALDARDSLGEGPWWDQGSGELLRVDILQGHIHRWNPANGSDSRLDVGEDIGFAVPTQRGNLIAGLRSGISIIGYAANDAENDVGSRELLCPVPGRSPARFNDGKTDRTGRIWAGTIVDDQSKPDAVFGRLHVDRFVSVLDGFSIANGLGWSPDNTTMYVTDSGVKTIWAFDFDEETLELTNRRPFVVDTDYTPDGLTVDAEGGVWSAKWDGSRVVRHAPDGSTTAVIHSPATRPTSCAFGGPNLDTLYVTTARAGLADVELSSTPAGSVLAAQPGVSGLPEVPAIGFD